MESTCPIHLKFNMDIMLVSEKLLLKHSNHPGYLPASPGGHNTLSMRVYVIVIKKYSHITQY